MREFCIQKEKEILTFVTVEFLIILLLIFIDLCDVRFQGESKGGYKVITESIDFLGQVLGNLGQRSREIRESHTLTFSESQKGVKESERSKST